MIFAWQAELSPPTKLVLKILLLNGWVTQEEIIKETYLAPRTVKYAIRNLREREVLEEKPNLYDLRRKYYKYKGKLCTDKGLYKTQNHSFR